MWREYLTHVGLWHQLNAVKGGKIHHVHTELPLGGVELIDICRPPASDRYSWHPFNRSDDFNGDWWNRLPYMQDDPWFVSARLGHHEVARMEFPLRTARPVQPSVYGTVTAPSPKPHKVRPDTQRPRAAPLPVERRR